MGLAFLRRELIEEEDYTCASICVTREEWQRCEFKYMILDASDDTPFLETDHPDGYNMILLHPETKELFWAYSYDFDFKTT